MKINKSKCIGCRSCVSNYPGIFEVRDGKAFIKDETVKDSEEYINLCPVDAIEK